MPANLPAESVLETENMDSRDVEGNGQVDGHHRADQRRTPEATEFPEFREPRIEKGRPNKGAAFSPFDGVPKTHTAQSRSKRSSFMTFDHASAKSCTKVSSASSVA